METYIMQIVNLTPHELNIYAAGQLIASIPASGNIARVEEVDMPREPILIPTQSGEFLPIPISIREYGKSTNLPSPNGITYYYVSAMVAQANPTRTDLLYAGKLIRNEKGQIVGVESFASAFNPNAEE